LRRIEWTCSAKCYLRPYRGGSGSCRTRC
jgi:hypothetical protein